MRARRHDPHGNPRQASVPPLGVAFEGLVAKLGAATPAHEIAEQRLAFARRTGEFGPDDPWYESRCRTFWDDVMTRTLAPGRILALPTLEPDEKLWGEALGRAHRGLFRARAAEEGAHLADVLSGSEFVVTELDEALGDALSSAEPDGTLFDGTVIALEVPVRLGLLPGAVFHPDGTTEAIRAVVVAARARGLTNDVLLDALLRMELSLRTLSRVKPSYAYRAEAL